MKKFTKGCLMTALILFLVGLVISLVSGFLGGFRQLHEMGLSDSYPGFYRNFVGDWRISFLPWFDYDYDYDDYYYDYDGDGSGNNIVEASENVRQRLVKMEENKEQLALTADTLVSLEIDVEDCNVLIQDSHDEYVWLLVDEVEGNKGRPRYKLEKEGAGSKLCIENEAKPYKGIWKSPHHTVCLRLPKGCKLNELEVSLGAGYMESIFMEAGEIDVSVGAGHLETEGFEGREVSVSVGAGEIFADSLTAGKAKLEVGAGRMNIQNFMARDEADIDVGMGDIVIAGTIEGNLDLECAMGNTTLSLTGSEDDHSYDVECGMGNVDVGSYSHGGLATSKSWNHGKNSKFDIECSMGNVTVTFEN